jgi:uncharacterized membrane protein
MDFLRDLLPFLTRPQKRRVAEAIARAEARTTGEIHVHVLKLAPPRPLLETAEKLFRELGLERTDHRNGVLILISKGDRRFAIWGDRGIHQAAGHPLWEEALAALQAGLRAQDHEKGVVAAVEAVGRALERHFPSHGPRKNQLSDEVTES